jgi:hypothetical protein
MLSRLFTVSSRQCYSMKPSGGYGLFSSTKQVCPEMRSALDLADEFMRSSKIRAAEDIYKNLIDKYPYVKEPYQKLWNSWVSHRLLKVPEKEMDRFIEKYEQYIELKTKDLKPS